jgi:hypothetical protein
VRVLDDLDKRGVHAYAPDWIGFGYSEKPQPRYGFDYTEQEFHTVRIRHCIKGNAKNRRQWPHSGVAVYRNPERRLEMLRHHNQGNPHHTACSNLQGDAVTGSLT